MTDQDLRDLLQERVADLTTTDLASTAWRDAARRRTRRRAGAVACLGAGALAVAGVVAIVDTRPEPRSDGAPAASSTTTAEPGPDAVSRGVQVWWSPDLFEETQLPWLPDSPLPREVVDAPEAAPDQAAHPLDRAVAALGVGDSAVKLLGRSGEQRLLDTPGLIATSSTLSPDGRRLVFADGHVLRVYALATGRWSEIDAGDAETAYVAWADDATLWLPPEPFRGRGPLLDLAGDRVGTAALGAPGDVVGGASADAVAMGPWKENSTGLVAQAWELSGAALPVRDPERDQADPPYLAVTGGRVAMALAFMTAVDEARQADTPIVLGWLDGDTVIYESRARDRDLLIAWDVGTRSFHLVLSIRPGGATSLARLDGR